ncbi:MAG TPA: cytochrome c/FTR1 family iron permease [Candidatus Binatia bacterium]|jgi:high-affinity iron transporter
MILPAANLSRLLVVSCLLLAPHLALAAEEARKLVTVVDYIGGDYKNAVQAGKVIHPEEYREMKEFSQRSLELAKQLKAGEKRDIEQNVKKLAVLIDRKADEKAVADLSRDIKEKLIKTYKIVTYPRTLPSLQAGKTVFIQNCAQCHGEDGKGDEPGRATMNPKEPAPTDFTDPNVMNGLSPFKAFNIISFGVEGTAMPNFSALTEEERWQAAFYVLSLRFTAEEAAQGAALISTAKVPAELQHVEPLSTSTDAELTEKLKPLFQENQSRRVLAYLRRGILEQQQNQAPLIAARTLLAEAMAFYEKNEKDKAYQRAVDAYLDGLELAEAELFAKDLSFGHALEDQFTQFRNAIRRGDSIAEVRSLYMQITAGLDRATQILSSHDTLNDSYIFINALLIILREGLEVALILAAILASLKIMGATEAMRYIHLGWILAIAAGLVTWFVAQSFLSLSGKHREAIEGFTTLVAAVVLFYVGYWLHTKAEARKWQQFIRDKVQGALSRQRLLALAGVSFVATYREAFEVVLFYQALWLQSAANPKPVVSGFAAGAAVLCLVTIVLFKLGLKIPINYFFGTTGILLYLLALVFAGQGVRELQATGWFSVTPLRFPPQISALGIYPTVETLAAQALVLLALIAMTLRAYREHGGEVKGT